MAARIFLYHNEDRSWIFGTTKQQVKERRMIEELAPTMCLSNITGRYQCQGKTKMTRTFSKDGEITASLSTFSPLRSSYLSEGDGG